MLSARAGRAIGIDLEIGRIDVDLDIVVDHRIDPDTGKAGVPARRAVIGADPHEPVDAAFGLGIAIGVLALDQQRAAFDARLFAGMVIDQIDLVAVAFGPA